MTLEEFYRICDNIKPDEYGCLHYPGAARGFYFRVSIKGEGGRRVHRLALERKLGRRIRPGYQALHTCDYPSCVQFSHLYEGTHAETMRDRALRNPDFHAWAKAGGEAVRKKYREDPEYRAKMQQNLSKGSEAARKKRD